MQRPVKWNTSLRLSCCWKFSTSLRCSFRQPSESASSTSTAAAPITAPLPDASNPLAMRSAHFDEDGRLSKRRFNTLHSSHVNSPSPCSWTQSQAVRKPSWSCSRLCLCETDTVQGSVNGSVNECQNACTGQQQNTASKGRRVWAVLDGAHQAEHVMNTLSSVRLSRNNIGVIRMRHRFFINPNTHSMPVQTRRTHVRTRSVAAHGDGGPCLNDSMPTSAAHLPLRTDTCCWW